MKISPIQKLNLSFIGLFIACIFIPSISRAGGSTLVIDEFRTCSEAVTTDEYIVVANYGETEINLNGYTVKKKTASLSSTPELIYAFGDFVLAAGDKVTIGHANYTGSSFIPYNGSASLADTNNVIILYMGTEIVDSVAYGSVTFADIEGSALKNPAKAVPYHRVTMPEINNNSLDFEAFLPPVETDPNAARLVISELMPAPETGEEEWFELFNPTSLDITLANLKICDALGTRHCYFFGATDTIKPGEYRAYSQSITKITLNNNGDWLELYDATDNFLTDSGGNYGEAEKGASLAAFGTEYKWTKTATSGAANIFTDIMETETDTQKPVAKNVKSRVSTAKKTSLSSGDDQASEPEAEDTAVKAADQEATQIASGNSGISKKMIGWALIILAAVLVLGYFLWYFRGYAKKVYDKVFRRDDSSRF